MTRIHELKIMIVLNGNYIGVEPTSDKLCDGVISSGVEKAREL
jgi:hypothetical protein